MISHFMFFPSLSNSLQCRFYLPHGLTVDNDDNLWVTDVGAHQVFKLTPIKKESTEVQVLIFDTWKKCTEFEVLEHKMDIFPI